MKRSKEQILKEIKTIEQQLTALTLELEDTINEGSSRDTKPFKEPTIRDFQVGDKVKVLTKGVVPFDTRNTYTVVGLTKKRVEVKIDCGTITRAPRSLRKVD